MSRAPLLTNSECQRGVDYVCWRDCRVSVPGDTTQATIPYRPARGEVLDGGDLIVRFGAGNFVLASTPEEDWPQESDFTSAELVQLDGGWS